MAETRMSTKFCYNCIYFCGASKTCDYIIIEEHPRPCPPATTLAACACKKTGRRIRTEENSDIMLLYTAGMDDGQIASRTGFGIQAIGQWRRRRELPPNSRGGRPKKHRRAEEK